MNGFLKTIPNVSCARSPALPGQQFTYLCTDQYKNPDGYRAVMEWYDRQVDRCAADPESRWVDTSAGPTHLLVAGPADAPPAVVLHGMNLNAAAMTTALERLSEVRRVYAIDVIGMPGKSAGTRPSRSGPGYPQWVGEVLSALEISTAEFVGQSGHDRNCGVRGAPVFGGGRGGSIWSGCGVPEVAFRRNQGALNTTFASVVGLWRWEGL